MLVSARWLAVSQRVAGRAAHEVKNALNGVAVNLEVVRSRLARAAAADPPGALPAPAAVAHFAEVASAQLEALSAISEAMLALARPVRDPPDVAALVAQLAVVLDAVARSEGGSLSVEGDAPGDEAAVAATSAEEARLLLAAALDAAVARGRDVKCRVGGGSKTSGGGRGDDASPAAGEATTTSAVSVAIEWRGGAGAGAPSAAAPSPPALSDEAFADAAREAGVGVERTPHAVTLTFPRATGARGHASPSHDQ